MAQAHAIPDILARVLAARGVSTSEVVAYLDPTLKALMPDPRTVTDLQKVAGRLVEAVLHQEAVAIFGDYDVDGASSSALISRYLAHFGIEPEIYIPDRIFEGYGPNAPALKALAQKASLIVTVDCGTNSAEAFSAVSDMNTEIVVIDHHQVGGALPEGIAVVNPNREDDLSGLGYLCAAGVVFMVLVETSRQLRERGHANVPDLMALLDLVALATVCDVVPLVDLNRAFVIRGLEIARLQKNRGLAALASVARISEPLNTFHLGFLLGPRINAGGRIGDASLGARLLTCDDRDTAERIAAELDRLNQERQAIEAAMVEEAKAGVEKEMQSAAPPAIVLAANANWHPGIAGLIAARLKEATGRPAFAIAVDGNGKGTGSGRSIPGFDLGKLVRRAVDEGLLVKGGGHAMAAGVTVEEGKLGALRAFFDDAAAAQVNELVASAVTKVDGAISARGVNVPLIEMVEKAGPFGTSNPQPVFALPNHTIAHMKPVGTGHLKLTVQSADGARLEAIAFRAAETPLGAMLAQGRERPIHLVGTLSVNHWNGRTTPQMRVIDAALPQ